MCCRIYKEGVIILCVNKAYQEDVIIIECVNILQRPTKEGY